jgi:hypothetical protein
MLKAILVVMPAMPAMQMTLQAGLLRLEEKITES